MLKRRIPTVLIVLLALCLTLAIAVSAFAAPGDSLRRTTTLWGANEVPGPGDPDGSGEAKIQINMKRHQLCYTLVVRHIAPATAAHIHVGDSTVAGPVVVPLGAPTDGSSSGCMQNMDPALLRAILRSPRDYYVNVHNADYPGGALRGQLRHPGN